MKKMMALALAVVIGGSFLVASPAQAWTKNDNLYFKIIREDAPDLKSVKKKTLKRNAKVTCKYLRAGGTVYEAIGIAEDNGLDYKTALALVAGAVVFYCPEEEKYI